MIDEILQYNKAFVEKKGYETYITSKYPNKKICVNLRNLWDKENPTALSLPNHPERRFYP